jgi:hypothetical protein
MKTALLLIFFIALLSSCTKTDKSMLNTPCTDSCTTVQGRFITGNNEGVANISYEIKSEIRPTLGLGQTTIRKIATGETDNTGFYSSTFSLQKREYGQMADATVSIHFNYDKTRFVPVTWYESFGAVEVLGRFKRKDTTVTADIFLTSRSKLKVRLESFVPLQPGDHFSVITSCGAGLNRMYTSGGHIEANQTITEGEIDACGNEQTTVTVRKRKNGVSTSSSTTISTPTGQTVAVTFAF